MKELNPHYVSAIERAGDGIRAFFQRVYSYMAGGLLVSGAVAYFTARPPLVGFFYKQTAEGAMTYTLLGWISILAPLILIFMLSSSLQKLRIERAQGLFWLFSALMGVSLSNILLLFSGESIVQAFLVTAGMFAGISLYGYTTRRSLASWGSFLLMGLWGVILAMLVNMFVGSSQLNLAVSILSVFIFVGLTAYDTQRLKDIYADADSGEQADAKAISGALSLYLNFINLFRLMLYFMNDRR